MLASWKWSAGGLGATFARCAPLALVAMFSGCPFAPVFDAGSVMDAGSMDESEDMEAGDDAGATDEDSAVDDADLGDTVETDTAVDDASEDVSSPADAAPVDP